jgi:hypothetical protein
MQANTPSGAIVETAEMGRLASLKSVGPNASVEDDLERAIRELKAERDGGIEVAGRRCAFG